MNVERRVSISLSWSQLFFSCLLNFWTTFFSKSTSVIGFAGFSSRDSLLEWLLAVRTDCFLSRVRDSRIISSVSSVPSFSTFSGITLFSSRATCSTASTSVGSSCSKATTGSPAVSFKFTSRVENTFMMFTWSSLGHEIAVPMSYSVNSILGRVNISLKKILTHSSGPAGAFGTTLFSFFGRERSLGSSPPLPLTESF